MSKNSIYKATPETGNTPASTSGKISTELKINKQTIRRAASRFHNKKYKIYYRERIKMFKKIQGLMIGRINLYQSTVNKNKKIMHQILSKQH